MEKRFAILPVFKRIQLRSLAAPGTDTTNASKPLVCRDLLLTRSVPAAFQFSLFIWTCDELCQVGGPGCAAGLTRPGPTQPGPARQGIFFLGPARPDSALLRSALLYSARLYSAPLCPPYSQTLTTLPHLPGEYCCCKYV